ncbi:hypothetical protein H0I29_01370 [Polaribacter sp. R2A056_3_33]|uniref:Swt1 family HEPN domain-containing protein n=1 Tax=Polaribacter sp. R2A056_3_33 TaxID=2745563 RepID=UPI001C4FDB44|nr:Swt1 family HEPN domain-containing protein [Polaribacter sp. R2A056_3_33]QXP70775.1 hypothetical protein H0I29_01370 [Polaribacter sp. R2A056_3_33]
MKIGELVKNYIPHILNYCTSIDFRELERLCHKGYSKDTFDINYPFCVKIDDDIINEESNRFWKPSFRVNQLEYRVCSQWIISNKTKFLEYLLRIKIIDKNKYEELDQQVVYLPVNKLDRNVSGISASFLGQNKLETEAIEMSGYYKKFYYLERSIRILIEEVMHESFGDNWWQRIDSRVKRNVGNNLEYELDTSHTKRSERRIDYTTFGDLRKIINTHWDVFNVKFKRNLTSVNEVLIDLNRLRVPIAHCSPFVKKEVRRLEIRLDDWNDLLIQQEKKDETPVREIKEKRIVDKVSESKDSFVVVLGKKYYEDGFFNVRVRYSDQFGDDLSQIKIQLGDNPNNYTIGKINRTANSNATPRIFAGRLYKNWVQSYFNRGDIFRVDVIEKDFIKLSQVKNE